MSLFLVVIAEYPGSTKLSVKTLSNNWMVSERYQSIKISIN